jgi:hypothetical protein
MKKGKPAMLDENLEKLMNELADRTAEAVRPELAEKIKGQIPAGLDVHRHSLDTIRIIIDLRVGRLAAAAAIIIAIILSAGFSGANDRPGGSVYQDSMLLVKYLFGFDKSQPNKMLQDISDAGIFFSDGREVVYYGERAGQDNNQALIMHWKLDDGKYRVIYSDWRTEVVTAEQIIKLQAGMLQIKEKR